MLRMNCLCECTNKIVQHIKGHELKQPWKIHLSDLQVACEPGQGRQPWYTPYTYNLNKERQTSISWNEFSLTKPEVFHISQYDPRCRRRTAVYRKWAMLMNVTSSANPELIQFKPKFNKKNTETKYVKKQSKSKKDPTLYKKEMNKKMSESKTNKELIRYLKSIVDDFTKIIPTEGSRELEFDWTKQVSQESNDQESTPIKANLGKQGSKDGGQDTHADLSSNLTHDPRVISSRSSRSSKTKSKNTEVPQTPKDTRKIYTGTNSMVSATEQKLAPSDPEITPAYRRYLDFEKETRADKRSKDSEILRNYSSDSLSYYLGRYRNITSAEITDNRSNRTTDVHVHSDQVIYKRNDKNLAKPQNPYLQDCQMKKDEGFIYEDCPGICKKGRTYPYQVKPGEYSYPDVLDQRAHATQSRNQDWTNYEDDCHPLKKQCEGQSRYNVSHSVPISWHWSNKRDGDGSCGDFNHHENNAPSISRFRHQSSDLRMLSYSPFPVAPHVCLEGNRQATYPTDQCFYGQLDHQERPSVEIKDYPQYEKGSQPCPDDVSYKVPTEHFHKKFRMKERFWQHKNDFIDHSFDGRE